MDMVAFLASVSWQHWAVLGLVLLIAEMASGTTYLLWPAVAAFLTALVALTGLGLLAEVAIFGVLCVVLTIIGRPIVQRWRNEHAASGLNERSTSLIGTRGVVSTFANGVGSAKVGDTMWRVTSTEALESGQPVVVEGVDGATLKVKRA